MMDGWHLLNLAANYEGLRLTVFFLFAFAAIWPRSYFAFCALFILLHMILVRAA